MTGEGPLPPAAPRRAPAAAGRPGPGPPRTRRRREVPPRSPARTARTGWCWVAPADFRSPSL